MRLHVYVCIITQLLKCEQISASFSKSRAPYVICNRLLRWTMKGKNWENKWVIAELFMH